MPPFVQHATLVLALMHQRGLVEKDRTGGYMTVQNLNDMLFDPLLVARIGRVGGRHPEMRAKGLAELSREKALRLQNYAATQGKDVLSWQSRDKKCRKYGGAVRAGIYILSFSGLLESADEALMIAVAVRCELLTQQEARHIAAISNNQIYKQLDESL